MFPQPSEPESRPGELDAENRQANRNYDDRRPGRNNHDHSEQQYCGAHNTDDNSAGQSECNVESVHLPHLDRPAQSSGYYDRKFKMIDNANFFFPVAYRSLGKWIGHP